MALIKVFFHCLGNTCFFRSNHHMCSWTYAPPSDIRPEKLSTDYYCSCGYLKPDVRKEYDLSKLKRRHDMEKARL